MLSKAALMIGSALLLSTGISYGAPTTKECIEIEIGDGLNVYDEGSAYLDRNAKGSPQFPSYNGFVTTDGSKIHNFGLFDNTGRVTIDTVDPDRETFGATAVNLWDAGISYTQKFSVTENSTYSVINKYAALNGLDASVLNGSRNDDLAAVPMTGGFWIHPEGEDANTSIQLYDGLTKPNTSDTKLGSSVSKAGATLTFSGEDGENEILTLKSKNDLTGVYSQSAGTIGIGTPFVCGQGGSSNITMDGKRNVKLEVSAETNHAWYNTAGELAAPGYVDESQMPKSVCEFSITKQSYENFCKTYGDKHSVTELDYINYWIFKTNDSYTPITTDLGDSEVIDENGKVRAGQADEIDLSGACTNLGLDDYTNGNKTVAELKAKASEKLTELKTNFNVSTTDLKSLWEKAAAAGADAENKKAMVKDFISIITGDKKISELLGSYDDTEKANFRTFFGLKKDASDATVSTDSGVIGKFEEYNDLTDFLSDNGGATFNSLTTFYVTIPPHLERMAIANGIGAMGGASDGASADNVLKFDNWNDKDVLAPGDEKVTATATIGESDEWGAEPTATPTSGKHKANAAAYSTGVGVTYLNGDLDKEAIADVHSSMTGWSYSSNAGGGVNLETTARVNDNYTVLYDTRTTGAENYAEGNPLKAYVSAAGIGSSYLKNVTVNNWNVKILNEDGVVNTKAVYNYFSDGSGLEESGAGKKFENEDVEITLIPVEVLSTGIGFSNVADGSTNGKTTISKVGTGADEKPGMDVTLFSKVKSEAKLDFKFNEAITPENRHLNDFITYSNVASTAIGAGYVGDKNTFGDLSVYLNHAEDKEANGKTYKELLLDGDADSVNILSSVSNSLENSLENVGVATGIGVGIVKGGTIGDIKVTSDYKGWTNTDKDSEDNPISVVPQTLGMAVTGGRVATGIGVGVMGDTTAWTGLKWTVENVNLKQAGGSEALVKASQYATGIGVGEGNAAGLPILNVHVNDVKENVSVMATGNYTPVLPADGDSVYSGAVFFGQNGDLSTGFSSQANFAVDVNFKSDGGSLSAISHAPSKGFDPDEDSINVFTQAAIAQSFNKGEFTFNVNEEGSSRGSMTSIAYSNAQGSQNNTIENHVSAYGISSAGTSNTIKLRDTDLEVAAFAENATKFTGTAIGINLSNATATKNTVELNGATIKSYAQAFEGEVTKLVSEGICTSNVTTEAITLRNSSVFSTAMSDGIISGGTVSCHAISLGDSLGDVNVEASSGETSFLSSVSVTNEGNEDVASIYSTADRNIYFSNRSEEETRKNGDVYVSALNFTPGGMTGDSWNIGTLFKAVSSKTINLHVGAFSIDGDIKSDYEITEGGKTTFNGPGCLHLFGALGDVGNINIYNGWEVEISQDSSDKALEQVNISDGLISVLSGIQATKCNPHDVKDKILENHRIAEKNADEKISLDTKTLGDLNGLTYDGKLRAKKFIFGTTEVEEDDENGGTVGPKKVTYSGRIILGGDGSSEDSAQLFVESQLDNTTGFGLDAVPGTERGKFGETGVSVNAHVICTPLAEGTDQITNLISRTTTSGGTTSTGYLKVKPESRLEQGGDTYYMLKEDMSKNLVLKHDEYSEVTNLYFLVKENAGDTDENGFVLATAKVENDKLVEVADESHLVTLAVEPNPAAVKYADGEAGTAVADTNQMITNNVFGAVKPTGKDDPFLMVFGGRSKLDNSASYGYKGTLYGIVGGLDKMFDFGDGLLMKVGALVGYTHNKLDMNGAAVIKDKVWKQEMWTGGVYGHLEGYAFGEKFYNINGILSYGYLTNRLTRNDNRGEGDYTAKFHGSAINVSVEGEMNLCEVCSFHIGPWASVAYNRVNQKAYSEIGSGQHPYSLGKVHFDFLDTVIGAKASRVFASDDGTRDLTLYGHAGWLCQPVRNASKTNATISNVIANSTSPHFDFRQKNAFVCNLGLVKFLNENVDISGKVQFVVNGKYHDVVGNLALGYTF